MNAHAHYSLVGAILLTAAVAEPGHAASLSASSNAPVITGADIANYAPVTGGDKWFSESSTGAGSAKGQTFTTGNLPLQLRAITYQVTASQRAAPTKTYAIRVGTFSGTVFTATHSETGTQDFVWNEGEYMTWALDTPVLLSPNTSYAVDIGMLSSTSAWQTGIPYLTYTANAYTQGMFYSSGQSGTGDSDLHFTSGRDRIFHLDLQHPMQPHPESGSEVLAGDVPLRWTNYAPSTGSNVWVDLWFGTNAGALNRAVTNGLNATNATVTAPSADVYYWRVDAYLHGAPTGSAVVGTLFNFQVFDSDGDGFPDDYEMAHTSPPSPTGLKPGDDLEHDGSGDGLTNWVEYLLGTDPNNPDSDGDTLEDGAEVGGAGARPPTDPTKDDTDGDGLKDGIESHSGVWSSAADTGTDPTAKDTDADGLMDGVESNTGTFSSDTDTGTHPLDTDSDKDGAGDWYELAAAHTDPTVATNKPNVPYPLPDPDGASGATNRPVKVYILSGQSNMVGFGRRSGSQPGTLEHMTAQEHKFPNLIDDSGAWLPCSNVLYRGVISAIGNGPLAPGFGADGNSIGPELGFGQVMGWYHSEPVLLIKSSIGNRSLGWDCLPPGTPRYDYNGETYAGYGDAPGTWPVGDGPSPFIWYAGKQYDEFFVDESDMGPAGWVTATDYPENCQVRNNGTNYICLADHTSSASSEPGTGGTAAAYWTPHSVFNVVDVLDHFATEYPQFAAQGFEITGFVWWQGHKDQGEPHASHYETNMVNLIHALRAYYGTRYPGKVRANAPFVLATIGFDGWGLSGAGLTVANGQLAVSGETGNYPAFTGNVKTVETRDYWRDSSVSPTGTGYHYNHNAETYLLTGDALGRAMIDLLSATPSADYTTWTSLYPGQDLSDPQGDYDRDGVSNDRERIWGLSPTNAMSRSSMLPLDERTGTFTYTRRNPVLSRLTYTYQWSTNLAASSWSGFVPAQVNGDDGTPVETVQVTIGASLIAEPRLFVRVVAN